MSEAGSSAALNWNRVLPSVASTHRRELHLVCGSEVVFFDPVNCVGCLWRPLYQVAQITGPISAPEFVAAMVARAVALPTGAVMGAWTSAITNGSIYAEDAAAFARIAGELQCLSDAGGSTRH